MIFSARTRVCKKKLDAKKAFSRAAICGKDYAYKDAN